MLKYFFTTFIVAAVVGGISVAYQYRSFLPTSVLTSKSTTDDGVPFSLAGQVDLTKGGEAETFQFTEAKGGSFSEFKGSDTGTKYKNISEKLAEMEKYFAEHASEKPNLSMHIKRAVYFKLLASNALVNMEESYKKHQTIVAAYNGLYDSLSDIPKASLVEQLTPRHARLMNIYAVNYIYRSSESPSLFASSSFSKDPEFSKLLEDYKNNEGLVVGLYLDSLFTPSDMQHDNLLVAYKLRNTTRLLSYPEVAANAVLIERLKKGAAELIELFPRATLTRLTGVERENESRPLALFATSLGAFTRYTDSVSKDRAVQVFEVARKALEKSFGSKEDSLRLVKAQLDINYASFLWRANGNTMNEEVRRVLGDVALFDTSFKDNKEIAGVFMRYLSSSKTAIGKEDLARQDLLKMASQDSGVKELLERNGVEI